MNKFYAGIAATALAAAGLACGTGAAHATGTAGWPSALGYEPDSLVSTAVDPATGTVYTAAVSGYRAETETDPSYPGDVYVSTTTTAGATTHRKLTLSTAAGFQIAQITSVAVAQNGTVVIGASDSDGNPENAETGIWAATSGEGTATDIGPDASSSNVAISPNGHYAASASGNLIDTFDLTDATHLATSAALIGSGNASADTLLVGDNGTVYAAGEDETQSPALWTIDADATEPSSTQALAADPTALAVAGTSIVVGESEFDETTYTSTYSLEVVPSQGAHTSIALPSEPELLSATSDGKTVWAANRDTVMQVDLRDLARYKAADQVPTTDGWGYGQVDGIAPAGNTLYVAANTETYVASSEDDGDWVADPTSLYAVTAPGAVEQASYSRDDDGSIDVQWTAPSADAGAPLSYIVTATDTTDASADVIVTHGSADTDGSGSAYLSTDYDGISPDHDYTITVTPYDGFLGTSVTALPQLSSDDADVEIGGDFTVDSTVTADVEGWGSDVKLSYQWETVTEDENGDGAFTPVDGATDSALTLTDALLGKTIAVKVTGTKDGFAPTTITGWGDKVEAAPAPAVPGSATVTVSGNAVVGGTLTAAMSNDTFPAGTQLSYQWSYSCGECGGAIDGATGTTYSPTADMVGMQVGVIVTATLEGHSPVDIRSNSVTITAPATPTGPVQVGSVKAPAAIKSSAKKLTLTLAGVTTVPGKVKVYDGKKLIGKAVVKNGKLTVKLKKHLAKGKHKVTIKYAGSAQVAKFTKSVKLKVK